MPTYRPDVDGLRAICIVSVLMFHGGFDDWTGGFIGVDVFFVISGFLITSLIGRQIACGEFSLLGFYERRIRRLLAATIPVVVFTTLFALVFFTSADLITYCKSLIAFIAYSSNWFFLNQTGYFETPAMTSPLLHTWSLAVEEQFYLVFPALLLALLRFPRAAIWILAGLMALSFAYAQFEISRGLLDRAFYSSPARFWELLAGALLAMVPAAIDRTARIALPMRVIGLTMVGVPVFVYGPTTPFPGVAALIPVCGALLIIAARPDSKDPAWRLLTASPMVYLGKISYSLYLWHWPVLGATRALSFDKSELYSGLAIALSVALAALSYHLVEQPIRARRKLARGRDMAALLAATSLVGFVFGASGWATGGWPTPAASRVEAAVDRAFKHKVVPEGCFEHETPTERKFCTFGNTDSGKIDLLLWGDSHAVNLLAPVLKYAEARGLALALASRGACPPLFDVRRNPATDYNKGCPGFNASVGAFIRDNDIPAAIMAARWSLYWTRSWSMMDGVSSPAGPHDVLETAMQRTLEVLKDRAVMIVEQWPEAKYDVARAYLVLTRLGRPIDSLSFDLPAHMKRQRVVVRALDRAASFGNTLRINPAGVLCESGTCLVEADGKLLYRDSHHLTVDGSLLLYPLIERELDRLLADRRSAAAPSAGPAPRPQ
jgi:peptidoglycan/LPS O-acetylase OafA/YrhL